MPCQWSVTTTLFSTTQPIEETVEATDALHRAAKRVAGVHVVDEDVAAQDDALNLARAHSAGAHRPALEAVVVVGVVRSSDQVVLDPVVLEQAVVAQTPQAVGGEAVDQVLLDARVVTADTDPEADVAHATAPNGHTVGAHGDAARGHVHPIRSTPCRRRLPR